jgi:hypothetical protein
MLFDGIFTKINYCDEFFTMYGIYINIPVEISQTLHICTPTLSADLSDKSNNYHALFQSQGDIRKCKGLKPKIDTPMFSTLNKLETDILTSYMKSKPTQKPKTIIYKLTDFLQTKFTVCNNIIVGEKANNLKISGIWENKNNEIGLSFKFIT